MLSWRGKAIIMQSIQVTIDAIYELGYNKRGVKGHIFFGHGANQDTVNILKLRSEMTY